MKCMILLALATVALLCSGCSLMVANGLLEYKSLDTRLAAQRQTTIDKDGRKQTLTRFDTKADGGSEAKLGQESIQQWALRRVKAGETINEVAKAMGIDAALLREWIK